MDNEKIEEQLKSIESAIAVIRSMLGSNPGEESAEGAGSMVTPEKPAGGLGNGGMRQFLGM